MEEIVIGVIVGLLAIVGGFYCLYHVIKTTIGIIRIYRTSIATIGALPLDGQVKIVGKAENNSINKSPVSQNACIIWQVDVQKEQSSEDGSYWSSIYKKTSTEPFELNDGTGKIQIFPETSANLGKYPIFSNLILSDSPKQNILDISSPQFQDTLEELGIETTNFLGNKKTLRVVETFIESSEQLYIFGEIKYENGIKTITSKAGVPLIISNRNEQQLLRLFYFRLFIWLTGFFTLLFIIMMILAK